MLTINCYTWTTRTLGYMTFTVGFSRLSSIIISWLFSGGKEGHTSQHPNVLVGLRRPHIRREIFLAFCTKFERHTLQRRPSRNRGQGSCSARRCIYVKNVAIFVQKVASIWLKTAFLLQLFRTQMYFWL